MANETIVERTRLRADPIRNFKFQVSIFHPDNDLKTQLAAMGFMSVEGIAMNTEMVAYREGGWNTNPHKLPGQTDFAPLTMVGGVFYDKPGMWNAAKQMFAAQWGGGTIDMWGEFRFDMAVRVLDHPVTRFPADANLRTDTSTAILAFAFYNCWVASVSFNNLSSMDSSVLIHQMTVHHEGFETFFGKTNAASLKENDRLQSNAGNR